MLRYMGTVCHGQRLWERSRSSMASSTVAASSRAGAGVGFGGACSDPMAFSIVLDVKFGWGSCCCCLGVPSAIALSLLFAGGGDGAVASDMSLPLVVVLLFRRWGYNVIPHREVGVGDLLNDMESG